METIGAQLRQAREAMGVSTSEAASVTRIKVQHIEAMESNDFAVMAAPIYVKGFLRIYGEYLGLDPEMLVARYMQQSGPAPSPLAKEEPRRPQQKKVREKSAKEPKKPREPRQQIDFKALLAKATAVFQAIPTSVLKKVGLGVGIGVLAAALLIGSLLLVRSGIRHAEEKRAKRRREIPALLQEPPPPYLEPTQAPAS
jgi:transcriptional regulator with XRE-family HTH domain